MLSLLIVLPLARRHYYEIFLKSHYALAICAVISLWRHLDVKKAFERLYLLVAVSILAASTLARIIYTIFRNVSQGRPWGKARILLRSDAAQVFIYLARPWKVRAGQYIQLWLPGVSFWSFAQTHPFMITWWHDDVDGKAASICLLLKAQTGLTQKLYQRTGCDESFTAWVDGPYGTAHEVGDYGSVLMFATGIGIAAQIPYIKELLKGYRDCTVRTRNISLKWQYCKESRVPRGRSKWLSADCDY